METNDIEHEGTVIEITSTLVRVRITQQSACTGCHIASACTTADKKDKIIEVERDEQPISVGDTVIVVLSGKVGRKAIMLSSIYPLILIVLTLIFTHLFAFGDLQSGLAILIVTAIYYTGLYLCRNRLKKEVVFTLKKL